MHPSSFDSMASFALGNVHTRGNQPLTIVDIGSCADEVADPGFTYKSLFTLHPEWKYVGVDVRPGTNVDVVVKDSYDWQEIPDFAADIVISGQALEHIEFPWLTMREIGRIMKIEALCCIIVPWEGPLHSLPGEYPDCYRFLPDGMVALGLWGGIFPLYVNMNRAEKYRSGAKADFKDTTYIGTKLLQPTEEKIRAMQETISMPDSSDFIVYR